MNKFFSSLGGLVGSVFLGNIYLGWSYLSFLNTIFGYVSLLGAVVFSGALIWQGAKALFNKE